MPTWNLGDICSPVDRQALSTIFATIDKDVTTFEQHRKNLTEDITSEQVIAIIKESEAISLLLHTPAYYLHLKLTEDTAAHDINALNTTIDQFAADISNRMLFFSLWWKQLDEKNAERILKGLGKYTHMMKDSRKFAKHTLTEPEEKIINIKDITGAGSMNTIYDIMTNAYQFDFNGKTNLTQAQVMEYVKNKDPTLRKTAYETVYAQYKKDENVLGELYKNIVLDWTNEGLKLRHYDSPIGMRNLGNDLPDKAITALLETCQKNIGIFHEYFTLKATILKMKKLQRYDVYAPLTGTEKTITYDESCNTVLNVFKGFDEEFHTMAKRMMDEQHIHSELQKGKQSGAFCSSSIPNMTPYVLLNFVGKERDVSTMAHELGHAIHAMLSSHHHIFDYHAPLPICETASIFCEMLLEEHLLANTKSKDEKIHHLATQIDGVYASIIRQTYFTLFEQQAHDMIQNGATTPELNNAWLANLKEQFGDSVDVPDLFQHEWKYIPHIFHSPFYCYSYAFGNLLVLSLYNKYKQEGNDFIPKYKKILAYGGSQSPVDILKEVDIDITQTYFWQGGFDYIQTLVDQLKKELGA